ILSRTHGFVKYIIASEPYSPNMRHNGASVTLTMQGRSSLAERFSQLAQETPDRRRVDFELRALDVVLASLFLLVSLPLAVPIALTIMATSGRPVFYRGSRVGRGG